MTYKNLQDMNAEKRAIERPLLYASPLPVEQVITDTLLPWHQTYMAKCCLAGWTFERSDTSFLKWRAWRASAGFSAHTLLTLIEKMARYDPLAYWPHERAARHAVSQLRS